MTAGAVGMEELGVDDGGSSSFSAPPLQSGSKKPSLEFFYCFYSLPFSHYH